MSTKKKYESVSAMLDDVAGHDDALTGAELEKYIAERKLVKDLTILRSSHGLSQEDVASRLNRSQSWVSKLENGIDDDLSIGDLRAYISIFGLEFRAGAIKQGATIADEVKLLAFAIHKKLIHLAELAKTGDGVVEYVARFFGDAFANINRFLSDAASRLPKTPDNKPYISITMAEEMRFFEEDDKEETNSKNPLECRRTRKACALPQ